MTTTNDTFNVYRKLEKLKMFAERDCGAETENAIILIRTICRKYNITDFHFTPYDFAAKRAREEAAKARTAKEANETKETKKSNIEDRTWQKISHANYMKKVLRNFLVYAKIDFKIEKNDVFVFVNDDDFLSLSVKIEQIKTEWRKRLNEVDDLLDTWCKSRF